MGPTMCFKGIDNKSYYILTGDRKSTGRFYMNYTGCGNSVNLAHPAVIRMVLDSLRYWTQDKNACRRVSGSILASVLGREGGAVSKKSASFFDAISQDPDALPRQTDRPNRGTWALIKSGQFSRGMGQNGTGDSVILFASLQRAIADS